VTGSFVARGGTTLTLSRPGDLDQPGCSVWRSLDRGREGHSEAGNGQPEQNLAGLEEVGDLRGAEQLELGEPGGVGVRSRETRGVQLEVFQLDITKPADRDVVCHASAWDLDNQKPMKGAATRRILELISDLEAEGLL